MKSHIKLKTRSTASFSLKNNNLNNNIGVSFRDKDPLLERFQVIVNSTGKHEFIISSVGSAVPNWGAKSYRILQNTVSEVMANMQTFFEENHNENNK